MAKKSTIAEMEQRIRIVYELLLSGTPYKDIVRHAASNWGVGKRQTDNLLRRAREWITEEVDKAKEEALTQHIAKRIFLYNKSLRDGDRRLAFDVLRDEAKLLGIYPAEKREITGAEGGPIGFTISDIDKAQQELEAWQNERKNRGSD